MQDIKKESPGGLIIKSGCPGDSYIRFYKADNFCTASADTMVSQCSSKKARIEGSAFSGELYSESMLHILLNSLAE